VPKKLNQSNFTLKLLWRLREQTPAAQAQFICAVSAGLVRRAA
jgi:hypothetical protein